MAAACASPGRLRTSSSGSSACAAVTWPLPEIARAAREPILAPLPPAAMREKVQSPPRGGASTSSVPKKAKSSATHPSGSPIRNRNVVCPRRPRREMPRHREGELRTENAVTGRNKEDRKMKTRKLLGLITSGIVASAVQPAFQARAESQETPKAASLRLATGQYITPTALRASTQQFLNPKLSAYPSFVAGEAVRSQLSPDGTTLAVLCAGQNSLYKPDGTVDTANSTQYLFFYDVSGPHKQAPLLTQVLQQTNAHVGLVFSKDGGKLYAAGDRKSTR